MNHLISKRRIGGSTRFRDREAFWTHKRSRCIISTPSLAEMATRTAGHSADVAMTPQGPPVLRHPSPSRQVSQTHCWCYCWRCCRFCCCHCCCCCRCCHHHCCEALTCGYRHCCVLVRPCHYAAPPPCQLTSSQEIPMMTPVPLPMRMRMRQRWWRAACAAQLGRVTERQHYGEEGAGRSACGGESAATHRLLVSAPPRRRSALATSSAPL